VEFIAINPGHDYKLTTAQRNVLPKFIHNYSEGSSRGRMRSTHKADRIYEAKGGHLIQMLRGFHTKSRALLKQFDEQKLTALNTDGSEIKLIDIEFPK